MALFGKDRERTDRPPGPEPEVTSPPRGPSHREEQMFERERTYLDENTTTTAFLGKGSRVNGKLAFEGAVRIEGHVEGEISAQDSLTIGETAVVNAQIN